MSAPPLPQRKSIRYPGHDYRNPGAYFVTICTINRTCFFSQESVKKITESCWQEIPGHFSSVTLDEFIVMPNHLHGIIVLRSNMDHPPGACLATILSRYKAAVSREIRRTVLPEFAWQRNYFERIIRDEKELAQTQLYIRENPRRWDEDPENPERSER